MKIKKSECDEECVVNFRGSREYWCEWCNEEEVKEVEVKGEKEKVVIGWCRLKKRYIVVLSY